jgi:uncharacterized membrane protein
MPGQGENSLTPSPFGVRQDVQGNGKMMNETAPATADQERLLVILAYGLYLLSFAGGFSLLVGAIIAVVRKPHALGSIYESHYRNMLVVVIVMLAFGGMLAAAAMAGLLNLLFAFWAYPTSLFWPLSLSALALPVAAFCSLFLGLWFYWRVLRGFILVLDEKPY